MTAISATAPLITSIVALGELGGAVAPGTTLQVGGAAVLGLVGAVGLATTSPGLQWFGHAISRGAGELPLVSLTFDDGPHPMSTPALLEALATVQGRGTFFLLAEQVLAHPELARAIAADHEVGLHGLRHDASVCFLSPERGAAQLQLAREQISDVIGTDVSWYRPPFGMTSPRLVRAVELAGLTTIWCSVRTRDGVGGSPTWLRRKCRNIQAGDIVLLHEGDRPARHALGDILSDLQARGLRSVTVSELLAPEEGPRAGRE